MHIRRTAGKPRSVATGALAVVHCPEAFTLDPGHRLRAAHCLICRQLIGGQPAAVIGVAALGGEACTCGGVISDVFLIHAVHLPINPTELQTAIHRGIQCPNSHDYPA